MASFPVYLLPFNGQWVVIFPEDKDIGHSEYWEETVSFLVARHYRIPHQMLENLPYCQRRVRIVEPKWLYYGEQEDSELLRTVREAVGIPNLKFVYDDHERRLRHDVSQLKRLIDRSRRNSRTG